MTESRRRSLWKGVLRQTGRDPAWLGYWLKRHRASEGLSPKTLAGRLGLSLEGLVRLSLCQPPRPEHFREDLEVVCRETGADQAALAALLRQQQGLARWAEQAPASSGWLMAASDAPPADKEAREGEGHGA
jgi:hypothetical protein